MSHYRSDPSVAPVRITRLTPRRVAAIGLPTATDARGPRLRANARADVRAARVFTNAVPVADEPTYADFLVDPAAAANDFVANESQEVS